MGTWGIARDMAKLNEENLSKLSRKGAFAKLKELGSKSKGKTYRFKQATPEVIEAIKQKQQADNIAYEKKRKRILLLCATIGILLLWLIFADLSFLFSN